MAIASATTTSAYEDLRPGSGALGGSGPGQLGRCGVFQLLPHKNLGGAGDGGAVTCRDGGLGPNASASGRARHAAPATATPRRGYNRPPRWPRRAAVLNVKLPLPAGTDSSAGASWRQLTGVSWKHPGFAAGRKPDRGAQLEPVVVAGIPPRVPTACPVGRGRCTPSPASAELGYRRASCATGSRGNWPSAGVQTIIYYPIPIPPPAAYAGWATARQPAGHRAADLESTQPADLPGTDRRQQARLWWR